MKMFVLPLMIIVFGIFGCLTTSTNAAPLEEDSKSNPDVQRFGEALAMENIQNLLPQQTWQIISYLLAPGRMNKREDDLPPGFIGVRGRRSNIDQSFEDFYRKILTHNGQNMLISPSEAKGLMKKGDNTNVYKDGFLGVRG